MSQAKSCVVVFILLGVAAIVASNVRAEMPGEGELKLFVDHGSETTWVLGNNASDLSSLQIISPAGGLRVVSTASLFDVVIASQLQFYAEGSLLETESLDGQAELRGVYDFQKGAQDLEFKYTYFTNDVTRLGHVEYAIPEPSSLVLALVGTLWLCLTRRRSPAA